jgi:tripartite ATP-independent transporter DctM subunit
MTPVLGGAFILLLLAGVPVAFAMIVSGASGVLLGSSFPPAIIIQRLLQPTQSFPLLAIPFFIIAGNLMMSGAIGARLIGFARLLVGGFQGGLGQVSVMGSLVFGGVSGSAVADASAMGSALIPWQVREGYPPAFAGAVNASSSTLALLVPPSIPFILYAIASETSIGALFVAGVIPGVLLAAGQLTVCYAMGRTRGFPVFHDEERRAALLASAMGALPAILMPIFIVATLRFGIATPTEVSVMAVAYALLVSAVIYRDLTPRRLWDCLVESLVLTGTVMLIIMASSLWQWILSVEQIPQAIAQWATASIHQSWLMVLAMIAVLLVVGTFLDLPPAILLLGPIFVAIANEIGLDLIQLGVVMVLGLSVGLYTPPVGTTLFISAAIARVPIGAICRELLPFYAVALMVLIAAGFLPWISLALL